MQGIAVNVQQNLTVGGTRTTIPNDNIGKLSYYLYCIGACIPGVVDEQFTDYENYYYFSAETKQAIIILAAILKPSILEGRVIFRASTSDMNAIKPGFSNAFLTLTERTNLTFMDVDESGAMGLNLKNTEVTKKMLYTETWLNNYYITPLQRIEQELNRAIQYQQQATYIPIRQQNSGNYVRYDADDGDDECPFGRFFLAFLMIVILPVIGICCACGYVQKDMKKHGGTFCCCVLLPAIAVSTFIYSQYIIPQLSQSLSS